ncbi:MAG: amino acid adenylation domain-containing protein [Solirubrobacterales bacterium]|nr:amino acid adenylation domain-containing protein [Solirubrobacterales bacterium]
MTGAEERLRITVQVDAQSSFSELLEQTRAALPGAPAADQDPPADAVLAIDQQPAQNSGDEAWILARRTEASVDLELHGDGSALGSDGEPAAIVGHLRTLLDAARADPSTPIAALAMLTEPERRRLLIDFNDTAADYPRECVHELIAQQARSTPDAIAVQFAEEQITYAELEARASQLAHHLVDLGVGAEVLVGICTTRSLAMVVGLLGILKAGGAYVPIDPAYPADRQAYMLGDAQAPVIVTQSSLQDSLPPGTAKIVCLDTDWPTIALRPSEPPDVAAEAEQLAYVIYTSGSTGNPKGVQISHRALVNFLTTMREKPGLVAEDVLVAVTTLSFDIAGLELYLPLTSGARIVLASSETCEDPRALSALLEQTQASIMQATPTTWRMLIDGGWRPMTGMKALCGGEALPVALADRLVAAGLELWNMYGPTETTIWSTCAKITTQGELLTIGRPIANTSLYILDALMSPVPVGVAGELWIGGDGLARGYRGRADLTGERFVAHPFDQTPGARIYRTGDLARYRSDGTVEFLGRIDHQVKVRGFRIELGEIETVLARHPEVVDAIVVARGSGAEAELAAFVTAREKPVAAHELRLYLGQTLPDYMVPSTVDTLEAFPLTPNGKVDRKALPEPVRERSGAHELVAPRTPLERRLAAIWERELEIEPIGVTDNFFDLGVTSIVAATLFAAIEHDLGDSLPLGAIFKAPTIETLSRLIEDGDGASRWSSLIPIQPQGSRQPIFCVHGGAGTILHLQPLARRLGEEQPFYGLQSSGLYGGSTPIQSVEEMASHYLSEMRQVHPGGPWLIAGYCFGTIVAFEIAQRLLAEGEEVQMVALFNGPSPAWIHEWAWFGNQPSQRKLRPRPTRITRKQRLRRAIRQPWRFFTAFAYHAGQRLGKLRVKLALARARPIPEKLREEFFFDLHARAERAYAPIPYAKGLLVFYGDGLYEDPELGWGPFAEGGVHTFAVPGEQNNNRDVMKEPAVQFVAEQLQEYLQGRTPDSQPEAASAA